MIARICKKPLKHKIINVTCTQYETPKINIICSATISSM